MAYNLNEATAKLMDAIYFDPAGAYDLATNERTIRLALAAAYQAGQDDDPRALSNVLSKRHFVSVTAKIKTVNELNRRSTMFKDRVKRNHDAGLIELLLRSKTKRKPVFPVVVALTRFAPPGVGRHRQLDPHDALPAAMKHSVDAVARFLGIDDAEVDKVTWQYAQVEAKTYSVQVDIAESVT
jgi:hypothetical protein